MNCVTSMECAPLRKRRWFSSRVALFVGALAATLLAAPVALMAAPPTPRNKVTGAGTIIGFGDPRVQVSARGTATEAKGHFQIEYPTGLLIEGDIVCVAVADDLATLVGRITNSTGPGSDAWPEGQFVPIRIRDGGEPGALVDGANFDDAVSTNPGCPTPTGGTIPIDQGNYQVSSG